MESLPACISDWRKETLTIGFHQLTITLPSDPDRLLDDPLVQEENRRTDYMPYWASLWPAARLLTNVFLTKATPPSQRVLELGCGIGLAGLAALAAGMSVTMTDNRAEALQVARYNAEQNGFTQFITCTLDWTRPPAERYPCVIASDVLYEQKFHEPLLNALECLCEENGTIWIADPGRALLLDFIRLAQKRGWEPEIYDETLTQRLFASVGVFQILV
ncbi:MAG: methyltransferase domain-containing protein, partial [Planctomycetaceae bacterium]|nr:methyltransferase domain-containing protein [Planctomycetaceae bacterium]